MGANQRSMRVWHAAKSTPNALFGICPNQRSMRVWHAAGFQPRYNGLSLTISGLESPPTRKSGTKLTPIGFASLYPTDIYI